MGEKWVDENELRAEAIRQLWDMFANADEFRDLEWTILINRMVLVLKERMKTFD